MREEGQVALEYVLVIALIVIGLLMAFRDAKVGDAVGRAAQSIQNSVVSE